MIAPATRGMVRLSSTLIGRTSINVAPNAARLPENRFRLG